MIKTPLFWYRDDLSWHASILRPLSRCYLWAHRMNVKFKKPVRPKGHAKIICVGNATAGGSGKTPVVIKIYELLENAGYAVAIVSRGYGGRLRGPVKVDAKKHMAADTGDEPLMMAIQGKTVWIGRHRGQAIDLISADYDYILLDDGYQNPTVPRHLNLMVIDGAKGFGNKCLLPAGPLREPWEDAVKRADALVIIGEDQRHIAEDIACVSKKTPIMRASIKADSRTVKKLGAQPVSAFAGIGLPDKFFDLLKKEEINLHKTTAFADHHAYSETDMESLLAEGALPVTTEKDYVRVPQEYKSKVIPFPVTLEISNESKLQQVLNAGFRHRLKYKKQKPLAKRLRYLGEAALVYFMYGLFKIMPVDAASAVGGKTMGFIGPKLSVSRKAKRHVKKVFPHQPDIWCQQVITGMWENLGRVFAEYPHLDKLYDRMEVRGGEYMRQIVASDKGAILVGGHFANWEAYTLAARKFGIPLHLIYRRPNNYYIENLLRYSRQKGGAAGHIPKKVEGARQMVKVLKANESIGALVDQKFNEGMNVPFFDHPAMTTTAMAQLAIRYGYPLHMARIQRTKGAHFEVTIYPPIKIPEAGSREEKSYEIMSGIHRMFESWILDAPEQWLWLHRRWRDF